MGDDPLRTAWFPPERSRMILDRRQIGNSSPEGMRPMKKVAIAVGVTAGLIVVGTILGAVLGTQLNKTQQVTFALPPDLTTSATATTVTTARPDIPNPEALTADTEGIFTLENRTYEADLSDPNSARYKALSKEICDQIIQALPEDQVEGALCTIDEFRNGSLVVRYTIKVKVKKTVTVTKGSFGNMVESWIKRKFTGTKSFLKAKKDSFWFKNRAICNPNPCKYSGKCIDAGGGEFKCQCKPGKYGKTCDDDPTFCTCSGDPHCKTYDRLSMDYQGTCKFILSQAKDKSFTVYMRNINVKAMAEVSWSRYIELNYGSQVVRIGKLDPYDIMKQTAVWVNGVQVGLPYKNADVNIYRQGHSITCTTNFGLVVSYGQWRASVGLPSSFKNKVTGFCGNFDGNKKNDASTSSGSYVFAKRNFGNIVGNSYIVEDTEKQPYSSNCKLSDEQTGSPACLGVNLKKASLLCQQINNPSGKFKSCVQAMKPDDVADFSSWCDFDVRQTCDVTVATAAVTTFVQSCFEFDYTLVTKEVLDWKKEFNITEEEEFDTTDTCTNGRIPSTSGCENTCSNLNATQNCDLPDVISSCSCPPGFVSFKDSCVQPSECGCVHSDGSAHFINETWLNKDCSRRFACSAGGKISSSLNSCGSGKSCFRSKCSACNPSNPCKNGGSCIELDVSPGYRCKCRPGYFGPSCGSSFAACKCFGDPHCVTFDGLMLDYQGTRKHILVDWKGNQANEPFTIFGKNINFKGFPKVSLVNYVEFFYKNTIIRMTKAYKTSNAPIVVKVNFEEVEIPYEGNNITITRRGRFVQLDNHRGVLLSFSSSWQFKVKLSGDYFGKNLSGLCGNYDGAVGNDKTKADGSVVSESTYFVWGRELGDSFIVQDDAEDNEKLPTPSDTNPPQCPSDVLEAAKKSCALLSSPAGPFTKCLSKIPSRALQQRHDWCLFDVSMTCDASLSMDSLAELSDLCLEMNIAVDWRAVLKQPCQCSSAELTCVPLSSPCIPSCRDPLASETCQLPPVQDLCTCPPGKVLFQDKCIYPSECGCIDERGKSHQVGDVWTNKDCRAFKCIRSNLVEPQNFTCPDNTTCKDGVCKASGAQCTNETCDSAGGECFTDRRGSLLCRCKPGFTGNRCQYREAKCLCYGDVHCRTFDGLRLDYQGLCKYVLVNSTDPEDPFTVFGKNVVRFDKPRVSWVLYGEIHYNGSIVRIGRKSADDKNIGVHINGVLVTVSQVWFPGFQVTKTGAFQVFQSHNKKLQIFVGKDWSIKIILAPGGRGKVEGLCGNNNMLMEDDNTLKNGTLLGESNVEKSGKLIGDSYVVADHGAANISECTQPQTTPKPPPCPVAQAQKASSLCGAISNPNGVFPVCFPRGNQSRNSTSGLDILQYKIWCDFDFAETCQLAAVDAAISVFAKTCIEEAILNNILTVTRNITFNSTFEVEREIDTDVVSEIEKILNFRALLNLTMTCEDPNAVYSPRSTGCPATCENPNSSSYCSIPDVYDACVCPLGFLLFRNQCVLPGDCGCIQNNSAHFIGESWLTNNCTLRNTCIRDDNDTSVINSVPEQCPVKTQCTADNTCSACAPVSPCKNGAACEEGSNSSVTPYVCKCLPGFVGADCGEVLSTGSCYFFGNGHLITFDGLLLNPKSSCSFCLLQTSSFSLSLKTSHIDGVIKISHLELVRNSASIKLTVEQNASLVAYLNSSLPIEPPFNDSNFVLSYIGEQVSLSLGRDLQILYNEIGVRIKLSSLLKGKTKGVCGDFNGIAADDFKTSAGVQLTVSPDGSTDENETALFVNSYSNISDPKSCSIPKPSLLPRCSFDVLSFGGKCEEIINLQGPLRDCMSNFTDVVLNQTLKWCTDDLRDTCDVRVAGASISFLYFKCLGIIMKPLPPLCDLIQIPSCQCFKPNTVFVPKSTACPASCSKPATEDCRVADLINSCACTEGHVLFRGRCIAAGNCGCFDQNGGSHEIGETWTSSDCSVKYTCSAGGIINQESFFCNKTCIKGVCTACASPTKCPGGKCYDKNEPPGYFCRCNPGLEGDGVSCKQRVSGFCSIYGDPHYITFDKQFLDYQGTSKHVLAESLDPSRPFRVLGKNFLTKPTAKGSWLEYAEVLFKNETYKLHRANASIFAPIVVKVNESPLGVPFTAIDGSFNVKYDGDTVRFSTSIGLTVVFMPMFRANIEVTPDFKNNLTGLCGNFDGSPLNDLQVNGNDVSFLPDPGNAVGNSFVVKDEMSPNGPTVAPDITPPPSCSMDISSYKARCNDLGSHKGPFDECVKRMNQMEVQVEVESCLFDVQQTCSPEAVKVAFLTLARKCFHGFGIGVEKVKELECECTEPHTTCMATSSGCPATCSDPTSPDTCPVSDSIFVCACEPGRLLFNGKCVLPAECGCVYTDGRSFSIGDSWLSEDCSLKLTCKSPGLYDSDIHECPDNRTCVSGVCRACLKNPCSKNAACIETNSPSGYVCRCKPGYFGPTCSDALVTGSYVNTHCTTFDKMTFDFKGVGEFILVKSNGASPPLIRFEVRVTNVYLEGTGQVSYAKIVTIILVNYKITIYREGEGINAKIILKMNSAAVDLPFRSSDFDIFLNDPLRLTFSSTFGISCSYYVLDSGISVSLPTSYNSTGVSGLCGNFDGVPGNDLTTSDGRDVSDSTNPGEEIGSSYTNTSSPEFRNISSVPPMKNCTDLQLLEKCKLLTSLTGPLKALLLKLGEGAKVFESHCLSDVNRLCTKEALCLVAQRMSEAAGVNFDWRTPLQCDSTCPDGYDSTPIGSGCLPSCKDPTADQTCALPDVTLGCTCPPTKLYFKGRCVDRTQCGCVDNTTGVSYEIGKSWRNNGCMTRFVCGVGGNAAKEDLQGCSRGACVGSRCSGCQEKPCKNGGTCLDVDGEGYYVCRCPPGFRGRRCDGLNSRADVVILLENGISSCRGISSSALESSCVTNFIETVKTFLRNFFDDLVVGPGDVRASVATFMTDVTLQWTFNEYTTVAALKKAVDLNLTLSLDKDRTIDLTSSLELIFNVITSTGSDSPPSSPAIKILLVLTDGGSSSFDVYSVSSTAGKFSEAGINVCGVGLSSKVNVNVLRTICSEPKKIDYNFHPYVGNVSLKVLKEAVKLAEPNTTRLLNESSAKCRCSGDPHCKTFDGQRINYQGTCKILMASNVMDNATRDFPPFSLFLKSYHRHGNAKVSWVEYSEFQYKGRKVKFQRAGDFRVSPVVVSVDGTMVSIPYSSNHFVIDYNGNLVELRDTDSSLSVAYTSDGLTYITLPSRLSGKVTGLCGDYDGNARNDLRTREGLDVSGAADPGREIGDSYIQYYDADNAAILNDCKPPTLQNQTCPLDTKIWVERCRQLTNSSGVFKDCFPKLSSVAVELEMDCLFDLEQTCDKSTVELALSQFVRSCAEVEVFVDKWREVLDLPCECPKDKICQIRGSPCQPTFLNPDARSWCPLADTTDVCTCQPGKVLFGGVCVNPEQAGCVDASGGVRELKESWLSNDCQLLYTCTSGNAITSESVSCPDQTTCINGKCSACLQNLPCQNGGACLEQSLCHSKALPKPGCYWKEVPSTDNSVTFQAPSDVSSLSACFRACLISSEPCFGINWLPSAPLGHRCLLVPSQRSPSGQNKDSTQFLWVCSDKPCPSDSRDNLSPKPLYRCVCKRGFSGTSCEKAMKTCTLNVGAQLETFDGQSLLFRSTCKISLLRFKSVPGSTAASRFEVNVKDSARSGGSERRMLEVRFRGKVWRFEMTGTDLPRVLVPNGNSYAPLSTPLDGAEVSLKWNGNDLELTSPAIDGSIVCSSSGLVKVKLSTNLADQLEGVCGNMDGDKNNDGNSSVPDPGNLLSQQFFVPDEENPNADNCSVVDLNYKTINSTTNKLRCQAITDSSGPFAECLPKLDAVRLSLLRESCELEVDVSLDELAACDSLEKLLDWCNKDANVLLSTNWRAVLGCRCSCASGFYCKPRTSSCPATCSDPDAPQNCLTPDVQDSCVCPPGKLLSNDKCVSPEQCGCVDESGFSRQALDEWLNEDCSVLNVCQRNGSVLTTRHLCPHGSVCNNSVCSACSVRDPCQRGRCVDVGGSMLVCRCPMGSVGRNCEIDISNTCEIFGNGHCRTFDGARIDFGGECKILLVQALAPLAPFKVFGKNRRRSGNAFFLVQVEIQIEGNIVVFKQNGAEASATVDVLLNRKYVELPVKMPGFTLRHVGQKVQLATEHGFTASYHDSTLSVGVPRATAGNLRGLCGNFNNDEDDDSARSTATGRNTTSDQEVADSYIVLDPDSLQPNLCLPPEDREPPQPAPSPPTPPPSFTTTAPTGSTPEMLTYPPWNVTDQPERPGSTACNLLPADLDALSSLCNQLSDPRGIFGRCLQLLNSTLPSAADVLASFGSNCAEDARTSCSGTVVYKYFSSAASTCSAIGITVDWVVVLNTTYTCPIEGMVYQLHPTSPCLSTCSEPRAPRTCPFSEVGGLCTCPAGHVLHNKKCIPLSSCGCVSDSGETYNVGSTWFEGGCSVRKTCAKPGNIKTEDVGGSCDLACPNSCSCGQQ